MVRFRFKDKFADFHILGTGQMAVCQDDFPGTDIEVTDGFDALAKLAKAWGCEPQDISYNLAKNKLIGPTCDELDIAMFYRGCAVKEVWADSNEPRVYIPDFYKGSRGFSPIWRPAVTKVEWHILSGVPAYEKFGREMYDRFGYVDIFDFDGKPFHSSILLDKYESAMPAVEFGQETRVLKRLHDYTCNGELPSQKIAVAAMLYVKTELGKIMREYCESQFASQSGEHDVVLVSGIDYEVSINSSAVRSWDWSGSPVKYDVPWCDRSSFLLIRICSNRIRCPDEYRARIIGKKGVKVREIAMKHRRKYLQLV